MLHFTAERELSSNNYFYSSELYENKLLQFPIGTHLFDPGKSFSIDLITGRACADQLTRSV